MCMLETTDLGLLNGFTEIPERFHVKDIRMANMWMWGMKNNVAHKTIRILSGRRSAGIRRCAEKSRITWRRRKHCDVPALQ